MSKQAVKKGVIASLFSQTFGAFGRFILTKYNRNFFYLLLGGFLFLVIRNEVSEINTNSLILFAGIIIILSCLQYIGNMIENEIKK